MVSSTHLLVHLSPVVEAVLPPACHGPGHASRVPCADASNLRSTELHSTPVAEQPVTIKQRWCDEHLADVMRQRLVADFVGMTTFRRPR